MIEIIPRPTLDLTDETDWSKISPVLRRIYSARGLTRWVETQYELPHLLPFSTLKGIEAATDLLKAMLEQQGSICVIGDFDADGATSSALAVRVLRAFGAKEVSYLVPNRFTDGYGLTPEIVRVAAERQPKLIMTVDNGTSSLEGVQEAHRLGIQVLITDHHLAGDKLPEPAVIVNPNQPGDNFPSKALAGVGVVFYVLLALRSHLRSESWFEKQGLVEPNMAQYLDLVALGTVADLVPLDYNNRILVDQGLRRIRAGKAHCGIQSLLQIAQKEVASLQANDLGFAIGPRLNAAGRLEDMSLGIECLLTDDPVKGLEMAGKLDRLNKERREIEAQMSEQALEFLKPIHFQEIPPGLCLMNAYWHQGVIGILASRLKEKYHRPVIAFAPAGDNELKGSGRSIEGVHLRDVLDAIAKRHPGLLTKFGGHAMAVGLTLAKADFAAFQTAFVEEILRWIDVEQLHGKLYSDGELPVENLNLDLARQLEAGGPWGQGFPEPLFDGVFELIDQKLVGKNHLKLVLGKEDQCIEGIAFQINPQEWPNFRCQQVHIVYRLGINTFRNVASLQLIVEHLIPL